MAKYVGSGGVAKSKGLCQEMFELIKDRRTKSLVSGTVAKARKGGRSRNARFDYGFESIDD